MLHREACRALRVALPLRARVPMGDDVAEPLRIPVKGHDTPLKEVLAALLKSGSLVQADCEGLL